MKIALFHTQLPEPSRKLGGVEVMVHRLANELTAVPGNSVTVFSLTPKPEDAQYVHVHLFAGAPWLAQRKIFRLPLVPLLLNTIDFSGFDVLHLHGDDWFFFRRAIPTVRTMHGSALYEARTAKSLKRRIAQYCVYPLEHLSARLATLAVAVGPETARTYKIDRLSRNGVDLSTFTPGKKANRPTVLFVGTWEGRKRGKLAFEQFTTAVLPHVPDAQLIMVADHCPQHPCVIPVTYPDDQTLARLYREAWVFAYPSVYEGFGMTYVEAMASGTAVVASPNEGAAFVMDNGRCGSIVDDADFAGSIITLLQDSSQRTRLEETGVQHAAKFCWKHVADEHLAMYRDVRKAGREMPFIASDDGALLEKPSL